MSKPKKNSRAPPQPQKQPDRSLKASKSPKRLKMNPKRQKIKKTIIIFLLQNKIYCYIVIMCKDQTKIVQDRQPNLARGANKTYIVKVKVRFLSQFKFSSIFFKRGVKGNDMIYNCFLSNCKAKQTNCHLFVYDQIEYLVSIING